MAAGTCLGWTSPIGPKLKSSESPLDAPIEPSEDAWIASIIALGALIGRNHTVFAMNCTNLCNIFSFQPIAPFLAGPLADKIGRKRTLLSSAFFLMTAYVLMLMSNKVWQLLVARFLQGFGVGFVFTALPMYIGEISTDNVRGALGSLMQLFIVGKHNLIYGT